MAKIIIIIRLINVMSYYFKHHPHCFINKIEEVFTTTTFNSNLDFFKTSINVQLQLYFNFHQLATLALH